MRRDDINAEVLERLATVMQRAQQNSGTPAQRCYAHILKIVHGRNGQWSVAQRQQVQAMHDAGLIDASDLSWVQTRVAA